MIFLRFIGVFLLVQIISLLVRAVAVAVFVMIVFLFKDFSFGHFFVECMILSVGGTILSFLIPILFTGLTRTVKDSKVLAIIVALLFVWCIFDDGKLLLSDTHLTEAADMAINQLKDAAGSFYTFGAIVTLIAIFISYVLFSGALFLFQRD